MAMSIDFTDGDLGDLQPYFSRTGAQTGENGTLYTADRGNLMYQSADLTDAEWSKLAVTVTDNNDGSFRLTESAANSRHFIYQNNTVFDPAEPYTIAIEARAGTRDYVSFGLKQITGASPLHAVNADLTDCSITDTFSVGSPSQTNSTIEELSDGWCRITVTLADLDTNVYAEIGISNSASPAWSGAVASYLGDGTGYIDVRKPYVNEGATADPYLASGADNAAPAFTRDGVLLEESRTNQVSSSEQLTAAAGWNVRSTTVSESVPPSLTDPFGETITTETRLSVSSFGQPFWGVGITPVDGVRVWSVFFNAATSSIPYAALSHWNGTTEAHSVFSLTGDGSIVNQGNTAGAGVKRVGATSWYRIWIARTIAASDASSVWKLQVSNESNYAAGVPGNHADFWGAQLETGAFPTSYIPTSGTAVTRSPTGLDDITQSVWAPNGGSIVNDVEVAVLRRVPYSHDTNKGGFNRILQLQSSADPTNELTLIQHETADRIYLRRNDLGTTTDILSPFNGNQFQAGEWILTVLRLTSSGAKLWVTTENTAQTEVSGTGAVWEADFSTPLDTLHIGSGDGTNDTGEYQAIQIRTGSAVRSDAELAALTADDLKGGLGAGAFRFNNFRILSI